MNFLEEFSQSIDRHKTQVLVRYVGQSQAYFDEVMTLFLEQDIRIAQRAAGVITYAVEKYPNLLDDYYTILIEKLKTNPPNFIKRNVVRAWQFVEIPEEFMGEIANICFDYLDSQIEAIAVKVFSMTVLYHISQKEPDLQPELRLVIEKQLPYGSAGFKSRAKKILPNLK